MVRYYWRNPKLLHSGTPEDVPGLTRPATLLSALPVTYTVDIADENTIRQSAIAAHVELEDVPFPALALVLAVGKQSILVQTWACPQSRKFATPGEQAVVFASPSVRSGLASTSILT